MSSDSTAPIGSREVGELLLSRTRGYGFAFMDAAGVIVRWTPAAEWITGWTEQDLVGRPISVIFTPEDRARKLDQHELDIARKLGSAEDERWHLRKDGSRFWASGLCLPIGDDRGFIKIFKDATHLRARSEGIENTARLLERQQTRREDILGVVAHELRNPLSPIKHAALLLERRDGHPDVTRLVKIIRRQLETIERIVEDLVDITRVHTGKLRMDYQIVELQSTVLRALETVRDAARSKGVELSILLPPTPIKVEIDPVRIQQVVSNLLTNAIRYTDAGGKVWLTATVDATHFFLQVRDNGIGIGPELLPRIFEMFTQASEGGKSQHGLGIGLAVVKEIVDSHRGSIEVLSEGVGKGSEFTARIPLTRQAVPPLEPP